MRKYTLYGLMLGMLGLAATPSFAAPAPAAPLPFVANQGQWRYPGRFMAAVPGGWLFLEPGGFTYNLQPGRATCAEQPTAGRPAAAVAGHAYRVRLVGANPAPTLRGEDQQASYHNYFIGNDPARWASRVPLFGGVRYEQVYAGVDVRWHQSAPAGQLEYDFEVQPGANAAAIRLRYEGLDHKPELTAEGHLRLRTSVGDVVEQAPVAWQLTPQGQRRPLPCRFVLGGAGGHEVSFRLGAGYDPAQRLIIDPKLVFATYSGSPGGMSANATAPDAQGNMYTAGYSFGNQYPVTPGAYKTTNPGSINMVVAKLAADGRTQLFATYLGGSGGGILSWEYALDMKVDASNNVLVLGLSSGQDYPTTAGAYDRTLNGDQDYVITRLSSTGSSLLQSTFLGGSSQDGGNLSTEPASLELDPGTGDVLVAGSTQSGNFPVLNALQPTKGGGFGEMTGIVTRLKGDLSQLRWSTYLGGDRGAQAHCVKVAPSGEVYVSGFTASPNFPVGAGGLYPTRPGGAASGDIDGFVLRLSAAGQRLGGTYLGTTRTDVARFLDFDLAGNVLVGGATEGDYPRTAGTYSAVVPGTTSVFIHSLAPALNATVFATQLSLAQGGGLGGTFSGAAGNLLTAFGRDDCGRLYLCAYGAQISSPGAPCTNDAFKKEPSTFYTAVLAEGGTELLYGGFIGERTNSSMPGSTVHVHNAAAGKVTREGTLYQLSCAVGLNFGTTPGAFSPTNRTGGGNDGLAFKLELLPTTAVPGATASIAPVPTGCAPYTTALVALGASPRLNYRWDFGDGTPADLTATPTHTFAKAGTYTVRLVVEQPAGIISCGRPRDNAEITVVVREPLAAPRAQVPAVAAGCAPYAVQFANQSTGTGLSYRWDFGDGTPADLTATPAHTFAQAGTYTVRLLVTQPDSGPCGPQTSTTEQVVTVYAVPPVLRAQINQQPPTCVNTALRFGAEHNGAQQFAWDFGDGSPVETSATPTHTYTRPGTYTVRLRLLRPATNNCDLGEAEATLPVLVQAVPAPQQRLDSLDCRQLLDLDPALPNTLATVWNTGETTPRLAVRAPGTYRATVMVRNEACPVSVEFAVKAGQLYPAPNVITPNRDGKNDVFRLPASYGTPELQIFNRWGRLVYQTAAYTNSWSAEGLPADLYYYHVRRADCQLLLRGWVEVLR